MSLKRTLTPGMEAGAGGEMGETFPTTIKKKKKVDSREREGKEQGETM